ncbi:MAG TPA: patatin family protein [Methanocorpusculum sp.]|nr:patatin family protein [Methanocorpusculum sp.]
MKTGLVVEGGGMKCAYSAGLIDGLLDDGITFDECIGVSAGAANAASFVAGQRGRNIRFYTEHPKDPRYCGTSQFLKHGNFFNLQFIYGDLTNEGGKDPLDYDALMKSRTELFLTATDAETGMPHYFAKSEMPRNDYRIVMASCGIPALCKPVEVNGRMYYDGGVADSIPLKRILDDGCDKVVLLLENPRTFVRQAQGHKRAYHFMLRKYPKVAELVDTRHTRYQECLKWVYEMEKAGRVFIFAPPEGTGISTSTVDIPLLTKLYETGLSDYAKGREKMLAYLEG